MVSVIGFIALLATTPPPGVDLGSRDAMADAEPAEVLLAAHAAYDNADYARAAQLYEQVIIRGSDSGQLLFNLGNAYLRGGRLGRAIAAYRAAQARLPRDQDVRANLAFARKMTKDAIGPAESPAVLRTLFFWHFSFSARELLWILAAVNLLFWGTLGVLQLRRESEILRWLAVGLGLVLLAVGASVAVRTILPERIVVVQQHEIEVRSGTTRDTVVRFKLHEGTETAVVDTADGWVRIALPDGKQGWVEQTDVAVVVL